MTFFLTKEDVNNNIKKLIHMDAPVVNNTINKFNFDFSNGRYSLATKSEVVRKINGKTRGAIAFLKKDFTERFKNLTPKNK
ncbi:MAG: hypothetical protein HQ490_03885 [Lutibacter sp.]|nr:hypothetical protein [Lutibacter sp.]